MRFLIPLSLLLAILISCNSSSKDTNIKGENFRTDFTIAFGSCNNQFIENPFWKHIESHNPNVWIWGGDIVYSDTYDMAVLKQNYAIQNKNKEYSNFASKVEILGTWDDHDYGVNDGGIEYSEKKASQQLFLDFLKIPENDKRRIQEGVYHSQDFKIGSNSIKVLILDTRYFRTPLTPTDLPNKRYVPNNYGKGTILGENQWLWLDDQLKQSKANFNVIVSSIQVLSNEHGWETWGNMPHEVDKLINLIKTSNAKNTILLSGDRHISDFSKMEIEDLNYPIIDFTSSGLTHSATNNQGEPNKYRIGNLVNQKSFGILNFDFHKNTVTMEMRGENNIIQQSHIQQF